MRAGDFARLDRSFRRFLAWSRDVRGLAPGTLRWYRISYRGFSGYWRRHPRLTGVTAIDRWVAWNRTRVCAMSVTFLWRGVRAFYKYRHTHERARDLFAGLQAPPRPDTIPKALTLDECRAVLAAPAHMDWRGRYSRARAKAIVAIMLYAGLRRSEVLRVKLEDVDLADGTIRIVRGKGRGGGKDRVAYIPPALDTALRRYLQCRERSRVACAELFARRDRVTPAGAHVLQWLFHRLRLELGFRVSPQILRHSFVTRMLHCGIPLHIASGLAGHASIRTTMGYLRIWSREYRDWAARLRY